MGWTDADVAKALEARRMTPEMLMAQQYRLAMAWHNLCHIPCTDAELNFRSKQLQNAAVRLQAVRDYQLRLPVE